MSKHMSMEWEKDISTPTGDETVGRKKKSENDLYFERMVTNSRDKNLKLQLKSIERLEKGNWEVAGDRQVRFTQKLPTARNGYKARREENARISAAKNTFHDADRCTVREKAALEKYFAEVWQGKGDPEIAGENVPSDPALMDYVDSVLSLELDPAHFTDDYLSDHIQELFEYQRKIRKYSGLVKKYPRFFESLSDEKKIALQTRADSAAELTTVLKKHMELHGLELNRETGGFTVNLRRDSENARNRAAQQRTLKADYEAALNRFLKGRILEKEVDIARTVTKDRAYNSETAAAELESIYASNAKAMEVCGEEMGTAFSEIKKALKVRDEFIAKQRSLLIDYERETDDGEKAVLRESMRRNNKKIRLANKHVDRYRNFLDFCTGRKRGITENTAKFLLDEGHPEFMELVQLKLMGNCLENVLMGSERIEAAKNKAKDASFDNGMETQEDELEEKDVADSEELKKKEVEDYLKLTDDVVMDQDEFYKKVTEYKQLRQKGQRYHELKTIGNQKRKDAQKKADAFADGKKLKKKSVLADRFIEILSLPMKNKTDDIVLKEDGMSMLDCLAVFSGFEPEEGLSEELRSKVLKGVMPLINDLLKITPEQLPLMNCPADPDIEDHRYWYNKALVYIGQDMASLLNRMHDWNIPLTDDQYGHLVALGKVGEMFCNDYSEFEMRLSDPMCVIMDDTRINATSLAKINENIVSPYDGEQDPEDAGVAAKLDTYRRDQTGLKIDIPDKYGRKQGKYGTVREMSILEAVCGYVSRVNSLETARNYGVKDPAELYRLKKEMALADKNPIEDEKKSLNEYYASAGEEEAAESLKCKRDKEETDKLFSADQMEEWKLAFGDTSGGSSDIRSFRLLMLKLRPITRDLNGSLTEEGRINRMLIQRDFEDYISGDEKRRNRVLKFVGKELLKINLTDEMMTFDHAKENPSKIHDTLRIIHGFQNISRDYQDFFESDAFTEEERDRIRKNFVDSKAYTNFSHATSILCSGFGVDDSKDNCRIAPPADLKTKSAKEKQAWGKQQEEIYQMTARGLFEDTSDIGVAGAIEIKKKRDALYATKADEIRRASVLWAKTKAELERSGKFLKTLELRVKKFPDGQKKTMALNEIEKRREASGALSDKLEARLALCEEIKKYVYGEAEALSPEALALYEKEVKNAEKPTFIHAEVAEEIPLVKVPLNSKEEELDIKAKELSGKVLKDVLNELDLAEESQEKRISISSEEEGSEIRTDSKEEKKMPSLKASGLAPGTGYEKQDYHNCWACSGAAIFNKFMYLQDGNKLSAPVDQFDIRAFKPGKDQLKSLKEVNELAGVNVGQEAYDAQLGEIMGYMGEGKKLFGSIFETADFFMGKRKDFVLNSMSFTLKNGSSKKDTDRYEKQKKVFVDRVKEILKTGNLVAFMSKSHYLTITKLEGEAVTVLDSNADPGNMEEVKLVEELLDRTDNGNNVEITWFAPLKKPAEMEQDYPGLSYDEKTGYSYNIKEDLSDGALNLAQTKGICITRTGQALGEGMDGISHSTYIPKTLTAE